MLGLLLSVALGGDCDLRDGAYLLTVEPGDGVQTIFGHTALLLYDEQQAGYSPVYDWGRFDLEPMPALAWKVLNMTKDYYVASKPLEEVVDRYDGESRGMVVQRLDLSASEVEALARRVSDDLNDGGVFQYNWYDPNCTTMVRDHIDAVVGGALRSQLQEPGASPADEVLRHSASHLPLWLGLQWGSGRFARSPVSRYDAAFLPEQLHDELASATREGKPLVAATCTLGAEAYPGVRDDAPGHFAVLSVLGLLWGLALGASRRLGAGVAGLASSASGLLLGLWGSAALLVGALGTFAPFWGHHNLLFASPLHLALIAAGVWHLRRPGSTGPSRIAWACGASGVLGVVWSLLGVFADGNLGLAALTMGPVLGAAVALGARPQD